MWRDELGILRAYGYKEIRIFFSGIIKPDITRAESICSLVVLCHFKR